MTNTNVNGSVCSGKCVDVAVPSWAKCYYVCMCKAWPWEQKSLRKRKYSLIHKRQEKLVFIFEAILLSKF